MADLSSSHGPASDDFDCLAGMSSGTIENIGSDAEQAEYGDSGKGLRRLQYVLQGA
jgi:hypothetical protein